VSTSGDEEMQRKQTGRGTKLTLRHAAALEQGDRGVGLRGRHSGARQGNGLPPMRHSEPAGADSIGDKNPPPLSVA
jgi:hypothetical protein